jgi:hypothetical protein
LSAPCPGHKYGNTLPGKFDAHRPVPCKDKIMVHTKCVNIFIIISQLSDTARKCITTASPHLLKKLAQSHKA